MSEGPAIPPDLTDPTKGPEEPFSLLVVDDEESIREYLGRRLRREGFRVATAAGGAEALARLASDDFDLVLLDVIMPGPGGLDVLREIRRTRSPTELPVVMATALNQSDAVVRALALGANDYVTKPFDVPVVLARVRTQLWLRRSFREIVRLEARLSERNAELEAANAQLRLVNAQMHHDLEAAARVQAAYLPPSPMAAGVVRFAWSFTPCEELAGDGLNVVPLADGRVALYVFDVSGHGVAAALLAVTLARVLSVTPGHPSVLLRDREGEGAGGVAPPARVLARLSELYPGGWTTEQFFTILYGLADPRTGEVRYASAGHPPPVHLPRTGAARILPGRGLPVGVGGSQYEEHGVTLGRGDRLYLYSDGITDVCNAAGTPFGADRLLDTLERGRALPLTESLAALTADVRGWSGPEPVHDDMTVLAVEHAG